MKNRVIRRICGQGVGSALQTISLKISVALVFATLVALPATTAGASEFTTVMQEGRFIPGTGKPCGIDLKPHWDDFKKGGYRIAEKFAFGLMFSGIVVQKQREKENNEWLRFRDLAFFHHQMKIRGPGQNYLWSKPYKKRFLDYWQKTGGITKNYRACLKRDRRNCWDLAQADGIVDNYDEFVRKWDEIIGDDYNPTCLEWEPK